MEYAGTLVILSALAWFAERIRPARPSYRPVSARLQDLLYLLLNGHFAGMLLAIAAAALARAGLLLDPGWTGLASTLAWPVQLALHLVLFDLLQWGVHRLMHHLPILWRFHRIHHAIEDMDWMGNFHFHPAEILVYRTFLWLPTALAGFDPSVMLVTAVVTTAAGHLNHANLELPAGPWERIFNGPRMHLWHHAVTVETAGRPVNFAILFSAWDWVAGTAWLPDHPPSRLGLGPADAVPATLAGQLLDPFSPEVTDVTTPAPPRSLPATH